MKDYTKNGILADAYLRGQGTIDPEYVAEYVAEMKPSRSQRGATHGPYRPLYEKARRRVDDDLDD